MRSFFPTVIESVYNFKHNHELLIIGSRPFSRMNSAIGGRPMTSGRIGSAIGSRVVPGTASRLLESAMQVT